MIFKRIIEKIKSAWYKRNSASLISYYRNRGVLIGNRCVFRSPGTARIDIQRPELITIGNNVDMNKNFQILTHDWGCLVFRAKYHDFLNSTGKVVIGDNIYFGTDVIVLAGVTIGNNCIIAAGSIVTRDIPDNSIAAGVPCRVICSLDDYYSKRKENALAEAVERVKCFKNRFGRDPKPSELREEFIYYINQGNVDEYQRLGVPVRQQLSEAYDDWMKNHETSMFPDFKSFLDYCYKN